MLKSTRATVRAAAFGLFLFLSPCVFPANIAVPSMELITHAAPIDGVFALQTFGDITLEVQGGYKFGGSIAFDLISANMENLPAAANPLGLGFASASIVIRDLFALPLTLSYFIGQNDTFGSGAGFALFGAPPIMTAYRGFLYFPTGPLYDGIYQVDGTGARVEFIPSPEHLGFDLYVYEDTRSLYPGNDSPAFSALGSFSGDFRLMVNFDTLKLEAFLGGTYSPTAPAGLYRGGLLFYAANRNVEFLAQVGIPMWDPRAVPNLNINLFYLLVEPRLHLGWFSVVPTFFWHPSYYMQASNPSEQGAFDVNVNMYVGDVTKSIFRAGAEGNFRIWFSTGELQVKATPWIGFDTPGATWTLKVNAKLWPLATLANMFDGFVGVRAEL